MASLPPVPVAAKMAMRAGKSSTAPPGNHQANPAGIVSASRCGHSRKSMHSILISEVGGLAHDKCDWRYHGTTPSAV